MEVAGSTVVEALVEWTGRLRSWVTERRHAESTLKSVLCKALTWPYKFNLEGLIVLLHSLVLKPCESRDVGRKVSTLFL